MILGAMTDEEWTRVRQALANGKASGLLSMAQVAQRFDSTVRAVCGEAAQTEAGVAWGARFDVTVIGGVPVAEVVEQFQFACEALERALRQNADTDSFEEMMADLATH